MPDSRREIDKKLSDDVGKIHRRIDDHLKDYSIQTIDITNRITRLDVKSDNHGKILENLNSMVTKIQENLADISMLRNAVIEINNQKNTAYKAMWTAISGCVISLIGLLWKLIMSTFVPPK